MRTIFISCFRGIISRNILATDVLTGLRAAPGVRVVILAAESNAALLAREFDGPGLVVEAVPVPEPAGVDRLLWVVATNLLSTGTRRVQRRAKLGRDRNWLDWTAGVLLSFLGRSRAVRQAFRWLFDRFSPAAALAPYFDRYRPGLVFATDVYTPLDAKLLRLARRRGVKTVGMVRSWDNVTSKTLLTVVPDRLIVNAPQIRDEIVVYGDVPPERVFVTGVPHYDYYQSSPRTPRAEFCRPFGFDHKRPLVLFAPPSDLYLRYDPVAPVVLDALAGVGANILVRLPLVGKIDLGDYRLPPNAALDEPENSADFIEAHLTHEADRHLADSLYHSAVVVTWASTVIIDAMVFDKPVVLVGFDASPRPYHQSITQYYDYDHQRRILESGAVRLARSPQELTSAVSAYLADPGLNARARARVRAAYCDRLDGASGRRLAKFILSLLPLSPAEALL